ncbi:MAG TPA: TRAP transporter large permease [Burkholderiales bacterium]
MSNGAIAILGFIVLFALMAVRIPIGIALGIVGIGGFGAVAGMDAALNLLALSPIRTVTTYDFALIPMFILMGAFAAATGMSAELFRAGNAWFGRQRGGLALATISACAGFAAICGSSVATSATMTRIALPEMRRHGYSARVATGVIAAGGTLGILIPPSVVLAVYGFLTEQDIGKLFIAGIAPGVVAVVLLLATVKLIGVLRPELLPAGQRVPWSERWASLAGIWAVLLVFIAVIGGIYGGLVTATEAAALGAVGVLAVGLLRQRLTGADILGSLVESLRTSVSIFVVLIGALLFGYFLTITQVPQQLASWFAGLPIGPYGVLAVILVFYLILGCLLDAMAMIILTIPIIFPVVDQLGFDPIWFGVIVTMTVELGLITPPMGMNVFVINSVAPNVSLVEIFRGVMPFVLTLIVLVVILVLFPDLATFLPGLMA